MKKKSLLSGSFMLAMVAAIGGYHAFTSNSSLEGNLLMENVEALANKENTTQNTGPGELYDCPGVGTGDGKACMCSNNNPCTQILCK